MELDPVDKLWLRANWSPKFVGSLKGFGEELKGYAEIQGY
jgi:hypothetical protein